VGHADGVNGGQPLDEPGDRPSEPLPPAWIERAGLRVWPPHVVDEGAPFDELHREEPQRPVGEEPMEADDVRMQYSAGGPELALEPGHVVGPDVPQHLDGHRLTAGAVEAAEDVAETTRAQGRVEGDARVRPPGKRGRRPRACAGSGRRGAVLVQVARLMVMEQRQRLPSQLEVVAALAFDERTPRRRRQRERAFADRGEPGPVRRPQRPTPPPRGALRAPGAATPWPRRART
jgi:hypothetical protein